MNSKQAKALDLVNVLAHFGFYPKKRTSKYHLYKVRNEKTPSFYVYLETNLFMDFGTGVRGSVLDFIMWYKNYSFQEALDYCNNHFSDGISRGQKIDFEKEDEVKSYEYKVKELHSPALLDYVKQRGINLDFAREFCNEIHYQSFSKKKNKMVNYYGIGFENSLGGFAFRNQFLKFDLVAKSFSLIENFGDDYDSDILIFEGFFDFLSYITLTKKQLGFKYMPAMFESYIVLNSISVLQTKRFKDFFREFFQYKNQKSGFIKKVQCYLDNDEAGQKAFKYLKETFSEIKFIDKSGLYDDYNDLNEYLIDNLKKGKI